MSEFFGSPHALLVLVLAGFLPNEIWRMAGLWFGAAGYRQVYVTSLRAQASLFTFILGFAFLML